MESIECLLDVASSSEPDGEAVLQLDGVEERSIWERDGVALLKEVHFAQDTDIWVVGDLYGRLGTLWEIHRLWQARGQQPYVVGLGDMIDCGLRQLEVAAAMIAWRAMYPHKVSIVLGDHEHLRDMNSRYGFRCVDGNAA